MKKIMADLRYALACVEVGFIIGDRAEDWYDGIGQDGITKLKEAISKLEKEVK